ncbi:MAG: sensor histidine kinase [Syntrophomonadaceae bacterium]|nr:sensor histidine kinase [Syntrophomonadaceae bacterium]MDD3898134.1 sensor histidine kinase [Syntrophomonadaceae bacterium]
MESDNQYINDEEQPEQLTRLDRVLSQVLDTLEHGRDDIFDIAQDCHEIEVALQTELEEVNLQTRQVIMEVDHFEKLERYARLRLIDVSRDFRSYSQEHIQEAYEQAREMQLKLIDLRQQEVYLRRRRDELNRQIKKFKAIGQKADTFLQSTGLALKILRGNVERINDSIEESHRQQQMVTWVIESQEAERRKIARELHDGPAQSMASILIRLDLMKRLWNEDIQSIYEEIDNVSDMGRETLADIRRIMFDLKPSLLHENNLSNTLKDYFNDYEAKYNFTIDFLQLGQDKQYNLSLETALFRLVQEAITNIRKHSGVKRAIVKLEDNGSILILVIKDEGCGFEPGNSSDKESYGILGMKERVNLFGGKLDIISAPGAGTQVIIQVPLEGETKIG